jgi:hypothetical protein
MATKGRSIPRGQQNIDKNNGNNNNKNQPETPQPTPRPTPRPSPRSTQLKKPWLCRTKFFKNMIDSSFLLVNQDGSNDVDEKELYSGLLLIHLKLGTYAGQSACKVSTVPIYL